LPTFLTNYQFSSSNFGAGHSARVVDSGAKTICLKPLLKLSETVLKLSETRFERLLPAAAMMRQRPPALR